MSAGSGPSLPVQDEAARRDALDVARSFIVQAPAGSGKTELLIQRLLALLAIVDRPERVLAITFTRKAAGEMRERVVRALAAARDDAGEHALPAHERRTRALARAALEQDARHGWNLVVHPSRLAIQTIDSLAQGIALQAPLASGLPPHPRFTEHPAPLYLAAARAAIADADPGDPRWQALLDHQDNDADALALRLADLLTRRDQWRSLAVPGAGSVRERLERVLAEEIAGELAQVASRIGAADFAPIAAIARAVLPNLGDEWLTLRAALEACIARGSAPAPVADRIDEWREIAGWLLTRQDATLRKTAAKMPGVAAIRSGTAAADERRAVFDAVSQWLRALGRVPDLDGALRTIAALPPLRYPDGEWTRIEALVTLLPELAARLELAFAEAREIDFPAGTLAALRALGDGDAPGELLLRLDLRVDHLLVDEFQDTSYAHLDLIGRLVSGWTEGDGRTLFAVGDPMQSIYRFRGAEVRAFVEAQSERRIEGVAVEALTLRRNFRSQAGLVDWVNRCFPAVLGNENEPWQGRVAFADALAVRPAEPGPAATLDVAASDAGEAAIVVERVREALASGGDAAILVRYRAHLAEILPALRAAAIPYSAVDLDMLADRPAVRDVVALAHAIVQPDDRLAWLSVLRAPWCGLTLADLHAVVVAAGGPPLRSIEDVVLEPPRTLSPDGAQRLARCARVVADARRTHGLASLVERVRAAWIALGGPATLGEPLDLAAVDEVLALLAAHERAGELPDRSEFAAALARQRLSPPAGERPRVQVMTMHKAKGLEFDTVILPGLGRGRTRNDTPFMRWRTRRHGTLVGLARPKGGEPDGVYAYLQTLGRGEDEAELARLTYVACTRARRRLALVAVLSAGDDGWKLPGRGAILALFDASILDDASGVPAQAVDGPAAPAGPPELERLPSDWRPPALREPLVVASAPRAVEPAPPFDWARDRARRHGVVVHALLAQIARDGPAAWTGDRLAGQAGRIVAALAGEGATPAEAAVESREVRDTVARVLDDERGRWLLDPAHGEARSEWALAAVDEDRVVHIVVDRSFVSGGVRWIVEFKTGAHEGGDPRAYLDAEVERYRPQLERYARIVSALDSTPIRLGLYHPRVPGGWREFPAPAPGSGPR